jgi:hypothetical protein
MHSQFVDSGQVDSRLPALFEQAALRFDHVAVTATDLGSEVGCRLKQRNLDRLCFQPLTAEVST